MQTIINQRKFLYNILNSEMIHLTIYSIMPINAVIELCPTLGLKVSQSHVGRPVVHHIPSGEEGEGVKQLEDGIAGRVDGENDDTI